MPPALPSATIYSTPACWNTQNTCSEGVFQGARPMEAMEGHSQHLTGLSISGEGAIQLKQLHGHSGAKGGFKLHIPLQDADAFNAGVFRIFAGPGAGAADDSIADLGEFPS